MRGSQIFSEQNDFADRASAVSGAIAAFLAVTGVVVYHLSGGADSGLSQVYLPAAALGVFAAGFLAMGLGALQWSRRNQRTAGFTVAAHWGFWLGSIALLLWIVNLALPPQFS